MKIQNNTGCEAPAITSFEYEAVEVAEPNECYEDDVPQQDKSLPLPAKEFKEDKGLNYGKFTKSWSCNEQYNSIVMGHCIQSFLQKKSTDNLIIDYRGFRELKTAKHESETVMVEAIVIYSVNNLLVKYAVNGSNHRIECSSSIEGLVKEIEDVIQNHNPLIGGHFQLENGPYGLELIPKHLPDVTIDSVIMDESMKEDIVDNTIFHVNELDINNGVIFYGPPGTGKSLMCGALAKAGMKDQVTSITMTFKPSFSMIDEIIRLFLPKCFLIFEDIDTYGESREHGVNPGLSELLQFLNGISSATGKTIYIATTNYLDRLDDALKNRPVRFNRMYEFLAPEDEQVDLILEQLFNKECKDKYELCHNSNLTGAHLADVFRTCTMLSKKRSVNFDTVFTESVQKTKDTFKLSLNPPKLGFK